MLTINEVTEIFYLCDDFTKEFEKSYENRFLHQETAKRLETSLTGYHIAK